MEAEQKVGAVQLSARLRGVSPPVIRRLLITEPSSLAELHATLQVSFGTCIVFRFSGGNSATQPGQSSLRSPAAESTFRLPPLGLTEDTFLQFDIGEPFLYQYNLLVPWEIECRIEARGLIRHTQLVTCLAARGDPPDEDLAGPAAYPQWRMDSDPAWVLHQIEDLLDEDLEDACFRAEACDILSQARGKQLTRRMIADRHRQLPINAWDAGSLYEDASPAGH
jgi:hypothetical protein